MKDITKEKLIGLGFIKEFGCNGEPLDDNMYNYYTYNINDNCLLISDADDENDGNFTVELFDLDSICITNYDDLKNLIDILKRNIKKNG